MKKGLFSIAESSHYKSEIVKLDNCALFGLFCQLSLRKT